jgi:tetratricopeptide (TPR) repeat protein
MKRLLSILIATLLSNVGIYTFGQSEDIDSLLQKLEKCERDTLRVHLLISLSHKALYNDTGQVKHYLNEAFEISHDLNYALGIASYYTSLGNFYYRISSYESALKYYYMGLTISEQHQFIHQIMVATNGIGSVYFANKDFENAKKLYIQQLKAYSPVINTNLRFDFYNNIASSYAMLKKYDSALYYYDSALQIAIDENMERNTVLSEINIAMIYNMDHNHEKALEKLIKSLERAQVLGRNELIALSYLNIAKTFHQMGEHDKAIINAESCIMISNSFSFPDLRLNAHELLAEIYLKLNDAPMVFANLNKYISLKDSLLNETKNRQIAELHVRYELAKKTEVLKQSEEQALFRKRTLVFVTMFSIAIIVLLALSLLTFRLKLISKTKEEIIRNQEKQLLENNLEMRRLEELELVKELERNKDEVKNYMLQVMKFTKEKEKLIEVFAELKQFLSAEGLAVFKAMESDLKVDKFEMRLAEFEQQFKHANKDFFVRLLESHPNLTSSERQLSAFIALGLNGKEISKITQQSSNSIYVSRNRLKKKFDLGDINLESYLKSLLTEK